MDEMTPLERRAIKRALKGPEPWKAQILQQLDKLQVLRRETTGCGFYTYFVAQSDIPHVQVPEQAYSIPPQSTATHPGIAGEVFFLVWLKNNQIDFLECASGEPLTAMCVDKFIFT